MELYLSALLAILVQTKIIVKFFILKINLKIELLYFKKKTGKE